MAESEGFDTSTAGAVSRAASAAGNPLKKSRALRIFRQSALGIKKKSKLQVLLANLLFALCRDFWFKMKMAESFFIFTRHSERLFELKTSEFRCEIKF